MKKLIGWHLMYHANSSPYVRQFTTEEAMQKFLTRFAFSHMNDDGFWIDAWCKGELTISEDVGIKVIASSETTKEMP